MVEIVSSPSHLTSEVDFHMGKLSTYDLESARIKIARSGKTALECASDFSDQGDYAGAYQCLKVHSPDFDKAGIELLRVACINGKGVHQRWLDSIRQMAESKQISSTPSAVVDYFAGRITRLSEIITEFDRLLELQNN